MQGDTDLLNFLEKPIVIFIYFVIVLLRFCLIDVILN